MPASRQSNSARAAACLPARRPARGGRGAFTLVELIFVLALLAICALFVTSNMSGFFRGRALNSEARRMLSLTHYGQSRAVAEGVPVVLWINSKDSTYGLTVQSSFNRTEEGDTHANEYAADATLTIETPTTEVLPVSEQDDEKLGLSEGLAAIRFNPDGFIDESSVRQITIRQGTEAAVQLVPTANRLGYEILPLVLQN